MVITEFEYLLNYIALGLDSGNEDHGLNNWLSAMDDALEESNIPIAQQLIGFIRSFNLSSIGSAKVELARANWHESRFENEAAITYFRNAIKKFRRLGDLNSEALASNSLGLLYKKMGLNDQAAIHFYVSARIYKRLQDHKSLGEVLSNIGSIADAQRDWIKAIKYYKRAIRQFARVNAKRELAGAYNNLGVATEMIGDLNQAEALYLRCVDLLDEVDQSYSEAGWRIISNLAQLYVKCKQNDKSIDYHKRAYEIANELGLDNLCALTLNNLGTIYEAMGDMEKAVEYFREAMNYQTKRGDRIIQAMLLNNLGSVLTDFGKYDQAKIYLDESIALSREAKDLAGEARTMNNLAVLLEKQAQSESAIKIYQQAAEIFHNTGDIRREIITLINIASVAWRKGDNETGRKAFLSAWHLAQRKGYENESALLFQLRGDWYVSNKYSKNLARRWYMKAMGICTDETIREGLQQRLDSLAQ